MALLDGPKPLARDERRPLGASARPFADEELRCRRLDAISSLHNYTELLREAASADAPDSSPLRASPRRPTAFAFKLELKDGRWNIDGKCLPNLTAYR